MGNCTWPSIGGNGAASVNMDSIFSCIFMQNGPQDNLSVQNDWYDVVGTWIISNNNVDSANVPSGEIVINQEGVRRVHYSCSFFGDTNDDYEFGVFLNGVLIQSTVQRRDIGASILVGNVGGTCLPNCSPGDVLRLKVRCTNASNVSFTAVYAVLNENRFENSVEEEDVGYGIVILGAGDIAGDSLPYLLNIGGGQSDKKWYGYLWEYATGGDDYLHWQLPIPDWVDYDNFECRMRLYGIALNSGTGNSCIANVQSGIYSYSGDANANNWGATVQYQIEGKSQNDWCGEIVGQTVDTGVKLDIGNTPPVRGDILQTRMFLRNTGGWNAEIHLTNILLQFRAKWINNTVMPTSN